MTASSRAPFYDLFKLIVAIILLLIFFFLFIGMRPAQERQPELISVTSTSLPPSATIASASSTPPPPTQPPSQTAVPASSTPPPPTQPPSQTTVPVSSTPPPPTPPPSPTTTSIETSTPTPPPFTETPAPDEEPLPTPVVEIPSEPEDCAAISRSQLQVGMKAIIQRKLNFRTYPGLFNNLILTNNPGTEVEIVGGPACTRYQQGGAYLWWEIKLPNGLTGWSAEASAFGAFYFMEPTP